MLPDLFRRLKPLYGRRIDALWVEYQLADQDRRREIEELLTILAIRRLGIAIGDERIVLEPPPLSVIGQGEYTIGSVSYPGLAPYPFVLKREELLRHVFILGPTGTGKSTLIIGLLVQLLHDHVPFMVFDFKRNYRCLLPESGSLLVLTVGRNTAPLCIDALAPPGQVAFSEWADALADVISVSYLLMQGARNVLKSALLEAHRSFGVEARLHHAYELLTVALRECRPGSRRYGWLESSARSLEELCKGGFGSALNAINAASLGELLERPVVFELHSLGEDQKRFFCLLMLQAVLLLRKDEQVAREVLRHVLIFDEAHNVFPKDPYGTIGVPSRLAREVREYGEAIIAATQQADVAESLIANSGIKIIMRCDYPRDVDFASKLLQIEARWLPKIPLGFGIARLPVRYYNPFLFTFSPQVVKNTIVPDAVIAEQARSAALGAINQEQLLGEKEQQLLTDIARHPICAITVRYERLGWNPKTGNTIKDRLLQRRLAEFETITTPTGIVKILTLAKAGAAHVTTRTVAWRAGGVEHEYWRNAITELLQQHGWIVTPEHQIGNGQSVDLYAQRGQDELIIEVETGQSDVKRNVQKNAAAPMSLVVFFTSSAARERCSAAVQGVSVFTPREWALLCRRVQ